MLFEIIIPLSLKSEKKKKIFQVVQFNDRFKYWQHFLKNFSSPLINLLNTYKKKKNHISMFSQISFDIKL